MSQDVDAYYRQMAINYHEAAEKAKVDETSLHNQLRVLGTTGDQSKYIKTQRRLERMQAWEEKCAREEQRFEKAAEWMESHFDIKKPKLSGEVNANEAAPDNVSKPGGRESTDSNDTGGRNTPDNPPVKVSDSPVTSPSLD
jgi:hypothetical protein